MLIFGACQVPTIKKPGRTVVMETILMLGKCFYPLPEEAVGLAYIPRDKGPLGNHLLSHSPCPYFRSARECVWSLDFFPVWETTVPLPRWCVFPSCSVLPQPAGEEGSMAGKHPTCRALARRQVLRLFSHVILFHLNR